MKKIVILCLILVAAPVSLRAELRKFTDTNGREIQAELIAVRGDQVEMKVGGKVYTLPVSKFSESDAEYIKNWGEENPAPLKVRGMYVEFKKNTDKLKEPKSDDDKKKKDAAKISRTNFDYTITVRNTSTQDLPDLKVKYTIYKLVRERSSETGKSEMLEEITGEEEIDLLAKSSDYTLSTETVMTTDSEQKNKKAGTETVHSETMWGVVADVCHGDHVIRSGSSPDGLVARVKSYKESNE